MIRINLLPTKQVRRRRSGQRTLSIVILLGVIVVGAMVVWQGTFEEQQVLAQQQVKAAEARVAKLEKAKLQLEERQDQKAELETQLAALDKMKHDKTGPPQVLKFLSYVLTQKEDNLYNRDEIKAQEAAGWAPGWDSDQVWLSSIKESGASGPVREFSLKGFARSHEDVAEFYRRLESGIYFVNIDPVIQQVTQDVDFPQLEVVSFEASVLVTYNPEGTIRMAAADLPEALRAMFKKQLEAEREKTSEENDGKGGKG